MRRIITPAAFALLAAIAWSADQGPAQAPRGLPPSRQPAAAAPANPAPPPPKAVPAPASKSKAAANKPRLPDAQLEAVIRAKFAKSKLAPDNLTVRVQGGVATVEGKTEVVQHKGNATRMCKTAGAIAVNNHVVVSDAAKEKAAGNLEEGRRRAQIKRGDARSDPRQSATPPTPQTPAQKKNQ